MNFLVININAHLDQEWFCRLPTVKDCYRYFESLGSGHGPAVAIYDVDARRYHWINQYADRKQLDHVVNSALEHQQPQVLVW